MPGLDPPEVNRKQKQILAENEYILCIGESCDYIVLIISNVGFEEQMTLMEKETS